MGHVIEDSLNPEWDTMVEIFTADYTQVRTITFSVKGYDVKDVYSSREYVLVI